MRRCPRVEMDPCRCRCEGCKYHCAAHLSPWDRLWFPLRVRRARRRMRKRGATRK